MRARAALAAILALTLTCGRAEAEPAVPAAGAVSVIVTLQDQANLTTVGGGTHAARVRKAVTRLRAKADSTQGPIRAFLAERRAQGRVFAVQRFWVFNGLAVTAAPDVVAELAKSADVASVRPNATLAAPAPVTTSTSAEANISRVGAPLLWQLGIRGQGIVVANMDTGVDATHPDLAAQWRGGTNSWYDPNGEHSSEPFDANGHGTSTMGVMVVGAAVGTAVGMAPDARWVAVKIFNDNGVATVSGIHAGFQWLLDPDGDPSTADAPDVVNNSWTFQTPSCDLEFEPDLEALRAAAIVPVFAAGNSGPEETTSMSPANNPAALAIGATTEADALFSLSSRGPSACGGAETVYPELVAPGVDIRTTDLGGGYRSLSGTSLAAPHAAGALALLLSAFPDLAADAQEASLLDSAVDLGAPGPDNVFGYGRLDVLAAYDHLAAVRSWPPVYLSLTTAGPAGIPSLTGVRDEDVISFDGVSFRLVVDGSDLGLAATDIDALAVLDPETFLLSFSTPVMLPRIGSVDDSDIVRFHATALGSTTTGRFAMYFDGSDVGLTAAAQDIDAIETLTGGRLLISTRRATRVGRLAVSASDVVRFRPSSLGRTTRGKWSLYFDGSDARLGALAENLDGVALLGGYFYISTAGPFSVSGLAGDDDDIFRCQPTSLGLVTSCSFTPDLFVDGSGVGLAPTDVDAIDFPPGLSTGSDG
jgi:subtilisin family serine protease